MANFVLPAIKTITGAAKGLVKGAYTVGEKLAGEKIREEFGSIGELVTRGITKAFDKISSGFQVLAMFAKQTLISNEKQTALLQRIANGIKKLTHTDLGELEDEREAKRQMGKNGKPIQTISKKTKGFFEKLFGPLIGGAIGNLTGLIAKGLETITNLLTGLASGIGLAITAALAGLLTFAKGALVVALAAGAAKFFFDMGTKIGTFIGDKIEAWGKQFLIDYEKSSERMLKRQQLANLKHDSEIKLLRQQAIKAREEGDKEKLKAIQVRIATIEGNKNTTMAGLLNSLGETFVPRELRTIGGIMPVPIRDVNELKNAIRRYVEMTTGFVGLSDEETFAVYRKLRQARSDGDPRLSNMSKKELAIEAIQQNDLAKSIAAKQQMENERQQANLQSQQADLAKVLPQIQAGANAARAGIEAIPIIPRSLITPIERLEQLATTANDR